jgi:hypothetical protein
MILSNQTVTLQNKTSISKENYYISKQYESLPIGNICKSLKMKIFKNNE